MPYPTPVPSFEDIRDEFVNRVHTVGWASVAQVDRLGRLRSWVLHPIWDGRTGRIATGRQSLKARHRARTVMSR